MTVDRECNIINKDIVKIIAKLRKIMNFHKKGLLMFMSLGCICFGSLILIFKDDIFSVILNAVGVIVYFVLLFHSFFMLSAINHQGGHSFI